MEGKTLSDRAKETVVACMEHSQADPGAVAVLGSTYADILEAEAKVSAVGIGGGLLEEIKNL